MPNDIEGDWDFHAASCLQVECKRLNVVYTTESACRWKTFLKSIQSRTKILCTDTTAVHFYRCIR
jgi:hypothetical protein